MQFWMAVNFSFGTFLSWCGLLNKQCRFEALFSRKKHFWLPSINKVLPDHFLLIFGKVTKKIFLIIGYALWDYSSSGNTDFFILIECFDSQLFEQNTESLFSLKILRIKHPNKYTFSGFTNKVSSSFSYRPRENEISISKTGQF